MVDLVRADELEDMSVKGGFSKRSSPFGDGYRRVAANGINNLADARTIRWIPLVESEAQEIIDFLEATDGTTRVEWTPPNSDTEMTWLVESFSWKYQGTMLISVSAKLTRFYG